MYIVNPVENCLYLYFLVSRVDNLSSSKLVLSTNEFFVFNLIKSAKGYWTERKCIHNNRIFYVNNVSERLVLTFRRKRDEKVSQNSTNALRLYNP